MRVLLVDNFDSFVYNLAQAFGSLGAEPIVLRNDVGLDRMRSERPDAVVVSPGPGHPDEAGGSIDAIREFAGDVPVLGVCLGHQCLAVAYGGRVDRAQAGPVHGKTSAVTHTATGVFAGLASPFAATRYHSLAIRDETLPDVLEVVARSEDGTIMGARHKDLDLWGVQFHPESILCREGPRLLANFLALA
ncbi:MAG TPA: aminodeoxychorismate/anthranilate synthase component II [Actinomycetota bacterium]|nr:aminodeoxychorismate/anthranilate synthase component II [Actinomycetota bacterium]